MFDDPRNLRIRQQQDEDNAASTLDRLSKNETDLASTAAQLTQAQTDLSTTQAQLSQAQAQLAAAQTQITGLNTSVTKLNANAAAATAGQFVYAPPPGAPVVTGISPATGSAASGDTVTITGTGFSGVTAVSFGLAPAASFTFISDTQITAVSPARRRRPRECECDNSAREIGSNNGADDAMTIMTSVTPITTSM
jgi:hypothetical protein